MHYIRRLLLINAIVILLALMQVCILLIPFRYLAKRLSTVYMKPCRLTSQKQLGYARLIGLSIEKISQYIPWQSKCLVQAFVAKIILRQFKIANTLVIGVGFAVDSEFIAHAWVDVADFTIVGGRSNKQYTIIKSFIDISYMEERHSG